jgi:alkylhydroperoxidase family enzyme
VSGQQNGKTYDLRAVIGQDDLESGIPASVALSRFAKAICENDGVSIAACRAEVADQLGEAAMLDAAATIAAFNAFPRVADATGIPLEEMKVEPTAGIRADLGLEAFNLTGKLPG